MVLDARTAAQYIIAEPDKIHYAQHGIDLTLARVSYPKKGGKLLKEGVVWEEFSQEKPWWEDSNIPFPCKNPWKNTSCIITQLDKGRIEYRLMPGMYEIQFEQGISLPNTVKANIIHRSSLLRMGGMIAAGEYDPGFKTPKMGAFLFVFQPLVLEQGVRVAQIIFFQTLPCSPYNGQYQGK